MVPHQESWKCLVVINASNQATSASFSFRLSAFHACPFWLNSEDKQRAVLSLDCCWTYLLNFIFFHLFVHKSFSTAGATHGVSVIQVYGWTQGGDRWFMTWTCLIYCVIFFFFSAGRKSLRPVSVVWRLSACTVLMVGHLCPNKLIKKYSKCCYIPFIWDKNDRLSAMI